ncbi:MAG: DUF2298 domain-containing protein [Anaerolineales bacterium]
MLSFFLWYFVTTLLGLITFPLAFRLLPGLPDRGYAVSRILGLLLWGYGFWILGSLGVLGNDLGGLLFSLGVLLALSIWAMNRTGTHELTSWWVANRPVVIVVEVLFLVAFGAWALVRAANPEIASTEKPMELAFVNAILRSPSFPPNDPWLSGYAISYYYFGYVIVAMLTMLTSVPAGVAFNLAIALVFGLAAVGAFGIVYNLLFHNSQLSIDNSQLTIHNSLYALLGPFFTLILSNVEGFLDMLHARGLFWSTGPNGATGPDGAPVSAFWSWLNLKDLVNPPAEPLSWMPNRSWWWWRASRVVNDLNFGGAPMEVIDEFPFFSFLLADIHPHVLAIPFAFLAVTLALNLYFGGGRGKLRIAGIEWLALRMNSATFGLAALALGGLAFLNTWDFPIYVALFCGAYTFYQGQREGWGWERLWDFTVLGLALGVAGVLLYLPFYAGFSSQAGGILPNLLNPTRGAHLWVMFGTLLVPIFAYLFYLWRTEGRRLGRGLGIGLGATAALWVFSLLLAGLIALSPEGAAGIRLLGAPDAASLMSESLFRRFTAPAGWGTLSLVLGLTLALLFRNSSPSRSISSSSHRSSRSLPFSLLLILTATLLVLAPEFVYLRDQFGTRMNTVFKFYYQGWLLWGLAAAYGTAVLLQRVRGAGGAAYALVIAAVFVVGLAYPPLSLLNRTNRFNPSQGWGLDGTRLSHLSGDDVAAVEWLKTAPMGTLVEAVGGSYSGFARISGHSGVPALLGWPGHESQWRGGTEEMGSRETDIGTIYRSGSWEETETLLEQYDVRYIYIGSLERSTYRVNEVKFRRFLTPVFEQGQVVIYGVP